jgi:hypothetical protein
MRPAWIVSRRRGGDRLRDRGGVDRDEVGAGADRESVALDAERAGRGGGRQLEGDGQLLVGVEALAVADHVRPLQHVAGAVRPPRVADVVGAADHLDAGRAQRQHRRHRAVARGVREDRDARLRERLGRPRQLVAVDLAEAVGVADDDPPTEPAARRLRRDPPQLETAERAGVVEVDVDPLAVALGDPEDDLQLSLDVAVEPGRVEAADDVGAEHDRLLQQRRRAEVAQHARLREGDDLHAREVADALARLQHRLDARQAVARVDVDVRAQVAGAEGDHASGHRDGTLGDRRRRVDLGERRTLGLDPAAQRRLRDVRPPRQPRERLVEVDVAVHERRRQQRAAEVDPLGAGRARVGLRGRADRRDRPAVQQDRRPLAARRCHAARRHRAAGQRRAAGRKRARRRRAAGQRRADQQQRTGGGRHQASAFASSSG